MGNSVFKPKTHVHYSITHKFGGHSRTHNRGDIGGNEKHPRFNIGQDLQLLLVQLQCLKLCHSHGKSKYMHIWYMYQQLHITDHFTGLQNPFQLLLLNTLAG